MKPIDSLTDAEFTDAMRHAVRALPDAPVALQRAALALFPATGPAEQVKALAQAIVRRIEAVLTFDSWAGSALAHGMRSSRSATRHLLFSARGRDVDLRIRAEADAYTLTGQILGPDEAGTIEVTLDTTVPQPAHRTELDALGEFRLEGLPRGTYSVTLQLGADEIALPPIDVGELPV